MGRWWQWLAGPAVVKGRLLSPEVEATNRRSLRVWWVDVSYVTYLDVREADASLAAWTGSHLRWAGDSFVAGAGQLVGWVEHIDGHGTVVRAMTGRSRAAAAVRLWLTVGGLAMLPALALGPLLGWRLPIVVGALLFGSLRHHGREPSPAAAADALARLHQRVPPLLGAAPPPPIEVQGAGVGAGPSLAASILAGTRGGRWVRVISPHPQVLVAARLTESLMSGEGWTAEGRPVRIRRRSLPTGQLGFGGTVTPTRLAITRSVDEWRSGTEADVWGRIRAHPPGSLLLLRHGMRPAVRWFLVGLALVGLALVAWSAATCLVQGLGRLWGVPAGVVLVVLPLAALREAGRSAYHGPDLLARVVELADGSIDRSR